MRKKNLSPVKTICDERLKRQIVSEIPSPNGGNITAREKREREVQKAIALLDRVFSLLEEIEVKQQRKGKKV